MRVRSLLCRGLAMEKRSPVLVVLLLLLVAAFLAACEGARDVPPAEEKPLRPQNVFGFGGFYPGPSVNWVFPGPNGVTPQVGFGGLTPGGGVVGIHGGRGAAKKKP
jgi:hypothetical protein